MPGDEYSAVGGGGALKLKGAKVTKKKKKSKTSLEKNLSAAEGALKKRSESPAKDDKSAKPDGDRPEGEEEDRPVQQTESERQFEEIKRKRLLKMVESHPELLKSHRERVEERNVYLSKLSEHHDMPKIGPG